MNRKKKKTKIAKSCLAVALTRKTIKNDFIFRCKEIIKLICGETLLNKLPAGYFEKLYKVRDKKLKIVAALDSAINQTKINQFNELLQIFIDETKIVLPDGNEVPLIWYLEAGILLTDNWSSLQAPPGSFWEEIKLHFESCGRDGDFHSILEEKLLDIVVEICTLLSDYTDQIYRADISETSCYMLLSMNNEIIIHAFKPQVESIETKKGVRRAIRLGWPNEEFNWNFFNVKPSFLGFNSKGLDIPLELYISNHVFRRLEERINITPGIMHQILLLTFLERKIPHRWTENQCHVDFRVSDLKVGYLVVKLHGNKLMVHTFLFLTNSGTYEGDKIGRLLSIVKEDKKYMGIDTLPILNSYHIDENERLTQLFTDAGCATLLQMQHIKQFTTKQVADKNPESILKYLADAPYFKNAVQRQ